VSVPNERAGRQVRRGERKPKCVPCRECDYVYRDMRGRELFIKRRFRHDPCYCGREKSFRYLWRRTEDGDYLWRKPPDADWYLYRLDKIWPVKGQTVYWTEGEKDADALATAGISGLPVYATSHHQGAAVGATVEQAKWLLGARTVVLVADRDNAGAFDAENRVMLLEEARFDGLVEIARAREGKDAADHVAAGYKAHELVPVSMRDIIRAAKAYRGKAASERRAEYTGAKR